MTIQRLVPLVVILCLLLAGPTSAAPLGSPAAAPSAPAADASSANNGSIDFVQRIGGRYQSMQLVGTTAYLLGDSQLLSLDVANPAAPVIRDRMFMPANGDFKVAGGYVYVFAQTGGMTVVDIRDVADPQIASIYPPANLPRSWTVLDAQIQEQRLYLLTRRTAYPALLDLRVVDISDPLNPRESGVLEFGVLWNYHNSYLEVAGDYAYVNLGGANTDIKVISLADPQGPTVESVIPMDMAAGIGSITVGAQRLYVYYGTLANTTAVDIFSLAIPAQPARIGTYSHGMNFRPLAIDGFDMYVVSGDDAHIQLIDLADPAAPIAGGLLAPGYIAFFAARGRQAFAIGDRQGGFGISSLDFSNPAAPRSSGYLTLSPFSSAWPMTLSGDSLFALHNGSRLGRYSLANPLEPTLIASTPLNVSMLSMAVGDSATYLSSWSNQITVINHNNPAAPITADYPLGDPDPWRIHNIVVIAAQGKRVYAVVDGSRFDVLDFTTPSAPRLLGSFDHYVSRIAEGKGWFMEKAVLYGVDLSDPARLRVTSSLDLQEPVQDWLYHIGIVGTAQGVIYVTIAGKLIAIDISNPAQPAIQATLKLELPIISLWADDHYLYADSIDGVAVFDHSIPSRLVMLGSFTLGNTSTPEVQSSVLARNGVIYRGGHGITVLRSRTLLAQGTVRQINGQPFAGASIAASTGATRPVGADGTFLFQDLPRGPLTFTPSQAGYVFWPPSRTADLPSSAWLNFQVTAPPVAGSLPPGTQRSLAFTDTQGLPTSFILDTAALSATSSAVITPTPSPAPMRGFAFAGHAFELAVDPSVAVTATIRYSPADLRLASDPAALALWRWTGSGWAAVECAEPAAHDEAARSLMVGLCGPGAYALFAPTHQLLLPWIANE